MLDVEVLMLLDVGHVIVDVVDGLEVVPGGLFDGKGLVM